MNLNVVLLQARLVSTPGSCGCVSFHGKASTDTRVCRGAQGLAPVQPAVQE